MLWVPETCSGVQPDMRFLKRQMRLAILPLKKNNSLQTGAISVPVPYPTHNFPINVINHYHKIYDVLMLGSPLFNISSE